MQDEHAYLRHAPPMIPVADASRCLDEQTLAALISGELETIALDGVHEHLARCSVCVSVVGAAAHSVKHKSVEGNANARLLNGRYRVEQLLGHGGMGVVYRTWDELRREHVALKRLKDERPEAIYSIKQEFRALADVRHTNLVCLHDLFEDSGLWCFTMELVTGKTLFAIAGLTAAPNSVYGRRSARARRACSCGACSRNTEPQRALCVAENSRSNRPWQAQEAAGPRHALGLRASRLGAPARPLP